MPTLDAHENFDAPLMSSARRVDPAFTPKSEIARENSNGLCSGGRMFAKLSICHAEIVILLESRYGIYQTAGNHELLASKDPTFRAIEPGPGVADVGITGGFDRRVTAKGEGNMLAWPDFAGYGDGVVTNPLFHVNATYELARTIEPRALPIIGVGLRLVLTFFDGEEYFDEIGEFGRITMAGPGRQGLSFDIDLTDYLGMFFYGFTGLFAVSPWTYVEGDVIGVVIPEGSIDLGAKQQNVVVPEPSSMYLVLLGLVCLSRWGGGASASRHECFS
jgi:hypothetical protein